MGKYVEFAAIHTGTLAATTIHSGESVLYGFFVPSKLVAAATIGGFRTPAGSPINMTLPINTQGMVDINAGRGVKVPESLVITLGNVADVIMVQYEP